MDELNFELGDILWGRRNSDAIHPIVFIEDADTEFFIGAMLTHSNRFKVNILMKPEHFERTDEEGNVYSFQFNNTYLVEKKLMKKIEWKPFSKAGKLTELGIGFLLEKIGSQGPVLWEDYLEE